MPLGFLTIQGWGVADQQAEVVSTLDQAEEVLGGIHRLLDAQLTGLFGLGQQPGHFP
ncbi:hypothetical protein FQZ97_588720 [compost metagenome]